MLNLNAHRQQYEQWGAEDRRSTAELAPWLFNWGDRLVACKDSGLLASFELLGIDVESLPSGEVNLHAETMTQILNGFGSWPPILWWTVHRRQQASWPSGQFTDPVLAALDERMKQRQAATGRNFVNRHYLSVLATPTANRMGFQDKLHHYLDRNHGLLQAFAQALNTTYLQNRAFAYAAGEIESAVDRFEELLSTAVSAMGELGLKRLRGESLMAFLHDCASVVHAGQPLVAVPTQMMLDAWLGDALIEPLGKMLRVQAGPQKFLAAISIKEWPARPNGTRPRMLERLLKLPVELTLSLCWRKYDREETLKALKSRQTLFSITQYRPGAYLGAMLKGDKEMNQGRAREDKRQGTDALAQMTRKIESNQASLGAMNLTILVNGDSPEHLEEQVALVEQELRSARLLPLRETLGLTSAFAGSLPGQWAEPVRWIDMSSEHIADLAPIHSVRQGDMQNAYLSEQLGQVCPALVQFQTEHNTPFNFNFHVGDKAHTLIIGPSRGGKSVLINLLLALFKRYGQVRILRFDRDRSCRITTLLGSGRWVKPGESKINPCSLLHDERHAIFLASFIERLATAFGYVYDENDAQAVTEALAITRGLPFAQWRLRTVWAHITRPGLKSALAPWIEGGIYGHLFDHAEHQLDTAALDLCIEMGGLVAAPRAAELFVDFVLYQLEDLLNQQSKDALIPTVVYLEEAGEMLKQPWFALRADSMLKRLAKKLCHLILTVQSPEDGMNNPAIKASLRDNIATHILLPNKKIVSPSLSTLYEQELGLNEQQLKQLRMAQPKRQYLVLQEGVSRLIATDLDPWMVAHLRSDLLAQSLFDQFWQQGRGQPDWQDAYLAAVVKAGEPVEDNDED